MDSTLGEWGLEPNTFLFQDSFGTFVLLSLLDDLSQSNHDDVMMCSSNL